jgi:hypothetical protein
VWDESSQDRVHISSLVSGGFAFALASELMVFGPIFISAVTFWGLALGGGFYWARRYVRAIESQSAALDRIAALEARVRSLEGDSSERGRLAAPPSSAPRLR